MIIAKNEPLFEKSGKKIVFSFRIDETVYELIRKISERENRSINAQLEIFVDNAVAEYIESSNR